MLTPDQFATSYKSQVDSLFALSSKTFEGVEKFVDLNLNVAKATIAESQKHLEQLADIRDAQDFVQFGVALAQPTTEKVLAYSRHLGDITANTRNEYARFVESVIADANRRVVTLIDTAAKSAPTGTESAFAMSKSVLAAMNSAFESAKKAAQQFVDVTEANVAAATNATVKAAGQAASVTRINKKSAAA